MGERVEVRVINTRHSGKDREEGRESAGRKAGLIKRESQAKYYTSCHHHLSACLAQRCDVISIP